MKLYLKIWLAVVLAVALLTIAVGWVWRATMEPPLREILVRNAAGEVIGSGQVRRFRPPPIPTPQLPGSARPAGEPEGGEPGARGGPEFAVTMNNGQVLHIHLPRPGPPQGARPWWSREQLGFLWLLAIVGVAVALVTFPIVRALTKRLEALQRGVERWGQGALNTRVPVQGNDEVAFLAMRFNDAAARVEALMQAHKTLLANASHELRSPLTRIRMGLELGGAQGATNAQRQEIERSISELDELIGEILLASRLDQPDADLGTAELIDLTGLVAEACAQSGAELDAQAVRVSGMPKLLRRLVRNLLENARRYSAGEVHVRLTQQGAHAVLRVCDQGPGVPEALRDRIFEPFYRLPGASERDGGVGLGLALVRSIALRHGGSVACVAPGSGDHAGACFEVRLPTA